MVAPSLPPRPNRMTYSSEENPGARESAPLPAHVTALVNTPLTTFASGLRFPEGPIALEDGSVLLVEMRGKTLTRVQPDGGKHVVAQLEGGPNGAAIGPDGRC